MDQVESGLMMEEGTCPQPAKKFISVRCRQDVCKGVPMFDSGNTFGYGQKVKVMISQNTNR